ncbi:hypothetical protein B0H13DRAFT_1948395 [Mycena leptocephala]|nr:hypothetical protein B0H13DRAFT_1948395 [Mycena leptocephala]
MPCSDRPSHRRTLWDMCPPPVRCAPSIDSVLGSRPQQGTFGYTPRQLIHCGINDELHCGSEWPRILDSELPEPWSCEWDAFTDSFDWYEERQLDLVERYGHAFAGFVPALFVPQDPYRGATVLCPPGGAGTYYLWGSEIHQENLDPWTREMQRVEHFVRTADWNRLEEVVPLNE